MFSFRPANHLSFLFVLADISKLTFLYGPTVKATYPVNDYVERIIDNDRS